MNKEVIKEKILVQKKAKLIDILEINSKCYAKTMLILDTDNFEIEYKYYEIENDIIKDINEDDLEKVEQYFGKNHGLIVY